MKKIKVDKKELIAELIDRLIEDPEQDLVLVVPKGSSLGTSISNFHLLSREAKAANKNISIESVDESVLALARSSQVEARHPLLDSLPVSAFADIIPRSKVSKHTKSKKKGKAGVKPEPEPELEPGLEKKEEKKREPEVLPAVAKKESPEEVFLLEANPHRFRFRTTFSLKTILWLAVFVGVVFGVVFTINHFWGKATIDITFKKVSWAYDHSLSVDASVSKADAVKGILPGELFTLQKNVTQFFQASGKSNVSIKATGKVIIYNNYSSKSQTLVATTRFEAPDGKIFRIGNKVIVPGATMDGGKLIPSHIETGVIADKAGPDYNMGPVAKLTIPGFRGSPRYDGFYGEMKDAAKGGFIGERAVATADDLKAAKDKTTEILRSTLQSNFLSAYPADFKILDGASEVRVTKLNVNPNTDDNGKFNVFGEATMTAMGFKEEDLKSFLLSLAQSENPKLVFKDVNIAYKDISPDFTKKRMTFNISVTGTLWPDFDSDDFTSGILGKGAGNARSTISSLDGLSSAKISIWPMWLGSIPSDRSKVKVLVY